MSDETHRGWSHGVGEIQSVERNERTNRAVNKIAIINKTSHYLQFVTRNNRHIVFSLGHHKVVF